MQGRFRFSIFQLTLLATGLAALLAWSLKNRTPDLAWMESTLAYQIPATPESYLQPIPNQTNRLVITAGGILPGQHFDDGAELFQTAHRKGWESCRYHFYSNFEGEIGYQIKGRFKDVDFSNSQSVESAAILAYATGYNTCQKQITRLRSTHNENDLRRKLAHRKTDSLPILLIAIGCLCAFIIAILSRRQS